MLLIRQRAHHVNHDYQAGLFAVVALAILRETYPPVLLERKASRLRKETGNPNYRSKLASDLDLQALVIRSIMRPSKMLMLCPIVTASGVYICVLYSIIYIFFSTSSIIFKEVYNFSTFNSGLVFIACGIGALSGLVFQRQDFRETGPRRKDDYAGGPPSFPRPSTWSPKLFAWDICVWVGTVQTYLIDTFENRSASVNGANAALRGLAGALIPLSGLNLYKTLG
ncbi:hypothetical protein ACHAQJ_008708 [Trichoderma viride]